MATRKITIMNSADSPVVNHGIGNSSIAIDESNSKTPSATKSAPDGHSIDHNALHKKHRTQGAVRTVNFNSINTTRVNGWGTPHTLFIPPMTSVEDSLDWLTDSCISNPLSYAQSSLPRSPPISKILSHHSSLGEEGGQDGPELLGTFDPSTEVSKEFNIDINNRFNHSNDSNSLSPGVTCCVTCSAATSVSSNIAASPCW